MKTLLKFAMWGFIVLVGLSIIGAIIGSTGQSTRPASTVSTSASRGYSVLVTGSHRNIAFQGSLGWTNGGQYRSKSVQGKTPEIYEIGNASVVSVTFQKKDEFTDTTLTVEIHRGGQVVASESSSASYGVVSVATR